MATSLTTHTQTVPPGYTLAARPTTIAPKPVERIRPYKDFLTAALHHRFRRACYFIFAACYIESLLMSWSWPSFLGIRALLVFMPCLAIYIVRIANMHVGDRTATSTAETAYTLLTDWKTAHTLGWYVYSAWFFGEVYLWSRNESANLGWVDQGRKYDGAYWERPLLNENPIFLRVLWICLAVAQTTLHLVSDEDRLRTPERSPEKAHERDGSPSSTLQEVGRRAPRILGQVSRVLIPGVALTLPLYLAFIRYLVWPYFHTIGRLLFSSLPDYSRPTGLQHQAQLGWQALSSSFTLLLLWELSNNVFTILVSRPPLRREQPLTSEVKDAQGNVLNRSQDPNGSLLSGLKSKKQITKSFALWELWLICSEFDARRKTIYTEVDRAGGSAWSQVSQLCLDEISAIQLRIREALTPAQPNQPVAASQQQAAPSLPKIANRNVIENGDLFARSGNNDLAHRVGGMAKSIGQSPQGANAVNSRARKAIEWSADRVLSKEEQQRLSRQGLTQEANSTIAKILRSPPGEPFRQTFAQRVKAVVFGTPFSRRVDIMHASQALSILCAHSLKEDDYGQVAKSVPTIVRTYTIVVSQIANFVATLSPSWTDVLFVEEDRKLSEVEELLDVLKAGLEGVLLAFEEYADAVGVTKKELREAKEAIGKRPAMKQV